MRMYRRSLSPATSVCQPVQQLEELPDVELSKERLIWSVWDHEGEAADASPSEGEEAAEEAATRGKQELLALVQLGRSPARDPRARLD